MKAYSPIRTDLVIGMTLAELFLLILFVVWYSHGPGAGPNWEQIAANRQREIETLTSQLDADKGRIAELEKIEDFWRRNFGVSPPSTVEQVIDALKTQEGQRVRTELLRGFPRCDQGDNTLLEAALQNGHTELRIRQSIGSESLQQWAYSTGVTLPSVGAALTGDEAVETFLSTLERFYSHAKAMSRPCRFDYRLRWTTDADYRIGRERLERYLYPAGIVAAAGNEQ